MQSEAIPFLEKPPKLDGSLAGDVGFDPMGFSNSYDMKWLRVGIEHNLRIHAQSSLCMWKYGGNAKGTQRDTMVHWLWHGRGSGTEGDQCCSCLRALGTTSLSLLCPMSWLSAGGGAQERPCCYARCCWPHRAGVLPPPHVRSGRHSLRERLHCMILFHLQILPFRQP
jgi:hypothetical protein